jgi:ssDNA-binding Zn-finger/Zn-ribbon topoisomerase 1
MPKIPSVVGGPRLEVKMKKEYDLPCPKCSKDMRITEVKEGAVIECAECKNVTWRMDYELPWWAKTSKFVGSLIVTFVFGVATSLFSSWLYEKYTDSRQAGVDSQPPFTTIIKK